MLSDRQSMISYLKEAEKLRFSRIFPGDATRRPDQCPLGQTAPRMLFPVTGNKRIHYAFCNTEYDKILTPGEVLITTSSGWTREEWTLPHEMISMTFYSDYLRVIHILHDGSAPPPDGPDTFYHTRSSLSSEIQNLLNLILNGKYPGNFVCRACEAMVSLVREFLEADTEPFQGREEKEWSRVQELLDTHCVQNLSRAELAGLIDIHPVKLSRLIRKYKGIRLPEFRRNLRLKHAAALLQDTPLSIDEIADILGFSYTNYFIRVFREHYRCTPGEWRQNRGKI